MIWYFENEGGLEMSKRAKVHNCQFVHSTDLVPRQWDNWFWGAISSNAPFTWGDNNRSMITVQRFADHCEGWLKVFSEAESTTYYAKREWLKKIRKLPVYVLIDLEN